MLDYYGLPWDFPGMDSRPNSTPEARVSHVEQHMRDDFGAPKNFMPFLALHEFEALLFSSREELPKVMADPSGAAFAAIRDSVETPEEIDEGPSLSNDTPTPEIYTAYRKTLHGPL